jgi:ribosomal protein S18 acetylase RimI-like enzyme
VTTFPDVAGLKHMPLVQYCKRFRMEIDLEWVGPVPALPSGYAWGPWADELLPAHAEIKWRSFRDEFDARVFPNLGDRDGCLGLMRVIRDMPGFVPEATWLIEAPDGCCATVQGALDDNGKGMVQNLGVLPEHRGLGLGRALLLKCLHGFGRAGVKRAFLEASSRNRRAVRLYHQAGFVITKTFYREFTMPVAEAFVI